MEALVPIFGRSIVILVLIFGHNFHCPPPLLPPKKFSWEWLLRIFFFSPSISLSFCTFYSLFFPLPKACHVVASWICKLLSVLPAVSASPPLSPRMSWSHVTDTFTQTVPSLQVFFLQVAPNVCCSDVTRALVATRSISNFQKSFTSFLNTMEVLKPAWVSHDGNFTSFIPLHFSDVCLPVQFSFVAFNHCLHLFVQQYLR